MKLKKFALGALAVLVVGGTAGWLSLDKETRGLLAAMPTNRDLLFWSQPQRDAAFRAMDRISLLAKWHDIPAGSTPSPLPPGPPLKLQLDVDAYMAGQRGAALLVLQDGKLRLERYGLDFDRNGRWTSFSVAKSLTSTLMGAAIRDGFIKSLDDKVSVYIPEMKGSAYDDVSIRQLLTMTSGVKWNEDYADPKSDVAQFNNHKPEEGVDSLVSYMRKLPREVPAGTRWLYSTGETNLVGILINRATKKPLATYLSEKIWVPAGMEQKATWILSKTGQEISGCCIQAAPRDFARFGQFILNGAVVNGKSIVPEGWLADATTSRTTIGQPGRGYGYQWWTYDSGAFTARGIFGQGIFIDPKRKLVIVSNADWAGGARDPGASASREAFYQAVQKAVDDEAAAGPHS
ncbi:serine hydrolase domain-containing protein [Candidatus Aalborgicola defluviihabitans]|uniref:serine hydrolase domain-containing protein n=1 Tax=Candidatus Aalborgicola defluviihabitans TaxID=3386187 RepID=UPI001DE93501|nr:serine hydrolase [Burkholderiales bacterium]MBK7280649.1 serine hydrolase [Burkholderiales bacterium]